MYLCYTDEVTAEQHPPEASLPRADDLALDLIRSAARFTRVAGRVPGVAYSSVAWRVLSDLAAAGPVRVSELAQLQRVAQPTMTALVQRLESEAWVSRESDPADGRATLVRITPHGEADLADYRRRAAARVVPVLSALDEADRAALARAAELMQRIGDSI
ncbi:MAG: MarR family transcriptional regulator [Actinobacteria bacterium]|nr:MarR family transcriptional regulator [Actinomycetota bacterium]